MKIKAKILQKFVSKISLDKQLFTLSLEFKEEGIVSNTHSVDKMALTMGSLKKEAFEEYSAIGEIYVRNAGLLLEYLKTFKGDINLEKIDEYVLKIYDESREVFMILGSSEIAEYKVEELPTIDYKNTSKVILDKNKILSQVKADLSTLNSRNILIDKEDGKVTFEVGEKGTTDYTKNIVTATCTEKETVSVNEYFIGLLNAIDSEFSLKILTDEPILAEEETELTTFKCMIAPLVDN